MSNKHKSIPAAKMAGTLHAQPSPACGEINFDPDVAEIIEGLPTEKKAVMIRAFERFSGPLPHPSTLRGYEEVKEGFAERIMAMAENEQAHRHKCEDKIVSESTATSRRGQWLGFSIAVLFLIASIVLAILGKTVVSSILGGGTLVSLVAIFVTSNKPSPSKAGNG